MEQWRHIPVKVHGDMTIELFYCPLCRHNVYLSQTPFCPECKEVLENIRLFDDDKATHRMSINDGADLPT